MVFEKVAALIAEQIDCDAAEIKPETEFEALGIDSLDVTEIAMNIEDEFDIEFEADPTLKTVGELADAVEKKVG